MVRVGDTLADGSKVVEIGRDWVRLSSDRGGWELRLTSLPAGAAPPRLPTTAVPSEGKPPPTVAASRPAEGQPPLETGFGTLDAELTEIIAGVAANEANSANELASAVGAYLGLPADAEIAVTDMAFGTYDNAAAAKANLDRSGMVRVRIGAEAEGLLNPPAQLGVIRLQQGEGAGMVVRRSIADEPDAVGDVVAKALGEAPQLGVLLPGEIAAGAVDQHLVHFRVSDGVIV